MRKRLLKIIFVLLVVVFVLSVFGVKNLPERQKIENDLFIEPRQTLSERDDFSFDYREKTYHVYPQAEYELWGLVVSVNNINAWYNFYHDENSVNLKDVCVIWGDNLRSDAYLDVDYKSGEWTCYYSWFGPIHGEFYGNKLSNNHLLSDSKKVRDIIRQVNIGDQIYARGALVDYQEEGVGWSRRTSMSRDDTNQTSRSGGACEVFFVDDIEILKKGSPLWHLAKDWSLRIFIFLILGQVILFFLENRKFFLSKKSTF